MTGAPPFFSVIIPTFNRRRVLTEAIESVIAQTFADYEIIVVDDGSTDDTASFVTRQYPGVRLIRQPNKGVSSARNTGIKVAHGHWLAFLDSDDLWTARKLERQHDFINRNRSTVILHTDETWIRKGRRVNQARKHMKQGSDDSDELFRRSLKMCMVSPSSVVIHASLFTEVGMFDETMPVCEDYDMWLRIMARRRVDYLPEKLSIKRNAWPGADQLSASTWGMDRYRVYSLDKLVRSGVLTAGRERMALGEIKRKAAIIANGAGKRGKHRESARWMAISRNPRLVRGTQHAGAV